MRRVGGLVQPYVILMLAIGCRALSPSASAPLVTIESRHISIASPDGRALSADVYGSGNRGVVIVAHGGYSSLSSWQSEAELLAAYGFHVIVVESRAAADLARGLETSCLYDETCQAADVLAAMRDLRQRGATSISLIGGSLGAAAAAQASIDPAAPAIERVVLFAPAAIFAPEKIPGRKLFIVTRDDSNDAGPRLPGIRAQYDSAVDPKEWLLLEGSAHGQRILQTPQRDSVMRVVLRFLRAP